MSYGRVACRYEGSIADKVLAEARMLSDHMIEWRYGKDVGYGIMECGVGPDYYRCKEVQHLPTFKYANDPGCMK
jgi:hypothetical protein